MNRFSEMSCEETLITTGGVGFWGALGKIGVITGIALASYEKVKEWIYEDTKEKAYKAEMERLNSLQ